MIATLAFLVVALVLSNLYHLVNGRAYHRELEGFRAERVAALARTDDDQIKAYLEASATTSVLAKRLLAASVDAPAPGGEGAGEVADPDAWKHNPDAEMPVPAWWQAVLDDLALESTDEGRLRCIRRRCEAGETFTGYEAVLLAKEIGDAEVRDKMREILYPKEEPEPAPEKQSTPAFRWSSQRTVTMLCTVTCACGEPSYKESHRKINGVYYLNVYCKTGKCDGDGKKPVETSIALASNMIIVHADNAVWRCVDGSWIKAAID